METPTANPPDPHRPVDIEPGSQRARRYAHRTWLYAWTGVAAATLILLVILIAQNTRRVRVGWIIGHSRVSLVLLILFATLLGWLLGIATSILIRRRTRRQHPSATS